MEREIELSMGVIKYREVGSGPVVLFVHGFLASGSLWSGVVDRLSSKYRCIAPDWPLGSHTIPMNADADVTPGGVARLVAEFCERLDLRDVTLVGNDSGGAISQLVVTRHPERIGRLVLTTCDGFEIFPPPAFGYLWLVPRVPGLLWLMTKAMWRFRSLRHLPLAYGKATRTRLDDTLLDTWLRPSAESAGVRRDIRKLMLGVHPKLTIEAGRRLAGFDKPAVVIWTPDDRTFPLSLGERLAEALPQGRLRLVKDAGFFVPLDQPGEVAQHIDELHAERAPARRAG
jgi:pimeloyl-ACP methyl ester carboxylesterase